MKLLLCTDLDRTLIPNGAAPEDPAARGLLHTLCAHPGVTLVYVSGRDRQLVADALEAYALPRPAYAITDVGSTIYRLHGDTWQRLEPWLELLRREWPEGTVEQIKTVVDGVAGVVLQEPHKQNLFKVSYYVSLQQPTDDLRQKIAQTLSAAGIGANQIWSHDEVTRVGLLDILPTAADKYRAIRFLQKLLDFADTELVFAGDSGNDLQVINSDIPSILVANTAPDIKQAALDWARRRQRLGALYIARGAGPLASGNYSAGVIEGVCHFQPALQAWLKGRSL